MAALFKNMFPNQNYKTKVVKKSKGGNRRRKRIQQGTRRFDLTQKLRSRVGHSHDGEVDLREAVKKPEDEVLEEWLAANAMEAFNNVVVVWENFVADVCECPEMQAGPLHSYRWQENKKSKSVSLPAKEYIEKLLDWTAVQFSDDSIFPNETEVAPVFGKKFDLALRNILRKLFRVYGHVCCHHWERVKELQVEAELLLSFKHYYFFVRAFNLVSMTELEPLLGLIARIDPPSASSSMH